MKDHRSAKGGRNISRFILYSFISFLLVINLTGCVDDEPGKKEPSLNKEKLEEEGLLTEEEIVNVLSEELDLKEIDAQPPVEKETDIVPSAYELKDETGKLFVYVFGSIEERYKVFPSDFVGTHVPEDEGVGFYSHNAKNASIAVQTVDIAEKPDAIEDLMFLDKINRVIFHELNDITEETYTGESDLWEVKLSADYFDYELENSIEELSHGDLTFDLTYLEEDFEDIVYLGVLYNYDVKPSSYSRTGPIRGGEFVDQENEIPEPVLSENGKKTLESTGTDAIPEGLGEEEVEITVKWGKELGTFDERDSIVLKRVR